MPRCPSSAITGGQNDYRVARQVDPSNLSDRETAEGGPFGMRREDQAGEVRVGVNNGGVAGKMNPVRSRHLLERRRDRSLSGADDDTWMHASRRSGFSLCAWQRWISDIGRRGVVDHQHVLLAAIGGSWKVKTSGWNYCDRVTLREERITGPKGTEVHLEQRVI